MSITGDQSLLKQINRMALVRVIRRLPGLSRADVAKETGLTKSTVSLLVQELIDEGWLAERDAQVTGALGRRPTPLQIDPERLAMIGAELAVDGLQVVLVSLTGEILDSVSEPQADMGEAARVLARLGELIAIAGERAKALGRELLGIGIGVPGAVDERSGLLKVAPNLGWRDVEVLTQVRRTLEGNPLFNLPIYVQNEADVAALGEFEFGEAPVPEPLIYLSLGIGVGAGIVVSDRLFVGADGFAGEVGHSVLQRNGPLCSCGRRGCAEAFIGLRAIASRIAGAHGAGLSASDLASLVTSGKLEAVQAASEAGDYLGVLVQNLWTAFNPGRIVLGGPACAMGDAFVAAARETLERYASEAQLPTPELRLSHYGVQAVAVGAAALVLHKTTRPL